MKTYKILIILFSILSFSTYAQGRKHDKIRALKVAFITNELNLTSDEAEKFWPLFNDFEDKQQEIRKQKLKNRLHKANAETLSEKEASALLNEMETAEEELHQLRKKFVTNLKSVLPATKILKLKNAEDKFNKKLLQQYKNNPPQRP
jgi:Spy/CpxP family protein refolding chaperone